MAQVSGERNSPADQTPHLASPAFMCACALARSGLTCPKRPGATAAQPGPAYSSTPLRLCSSMPAASPAVWATWEKCAAASSCPGLNFTPHAPTLVQYAVLHALMPHHQPPTCVLAAAASRSASSSKSNLAAKRIARNTRRGSAGTQTNSEPDKCGRTSISHACKRKPKTHSRPPA